MKNVQTTIKKGTTFMHESHQESKKMTSNDRSPILKVDSQVINSSPTSVAGLIMKGRDLKPFWNNYSKEISKESWLPIKTDLQDFHLNSSSGFSKNLEEYLKVSKKKPEKTETSSTTSWKFSQSLQPDTMDEESTKIKTLKIRIQPNTLQKNMFNKFLSAHRYFYNQSVAEINNRYSSRIKEFTNNPTCVCCDDKKEPDSFTCKKHHNKQLPWKLNINRISIRTSLLKKNKDIKSSDPEVWQKDIPYDTRELAINSAISAYKSAVTNYKNGNIKKFNLSFQTRKKKTGIFWVNDTAGKIINNKIRIFPKIMKDDAFIRLTAREARRLPETIESDFKIFKDHHAWYVLLSIPTEPINNNKNKKSIVSLDPGQRTFLSGYSPDQKMIVSIGETAAAKVYNLHNKLDTLQHVSDTLKRKTKRKTKRNIKKKMDKTNFKIRNIINDMHNQTASWLSKTFGKILLPTFGTSKMQQGTILGSTTKRRLQCLSHYKFQQKLKWMCHKNGSKLFLIEEHYTTKTCGNCGIINDNVGSNKTFTCDHCKCRLNRDHNGARNIYIKTMTEHGVKK